MEESRLEHQEQMEKLQKEHSIQLEVNSFSSSQTDMAECCTQQHTLTLSSGPRGVLTGIMYSVFRLCSLQYGLRDEGRTQIAILIA